MTKLPDFQPPVAFDRIAGGWLVPERVDRAWLVSPNDGSRFDAQVETSASHLETALACAESVHNEGAWRRASPETRAAALEKIGSLLEGRAEEMAVAEAATTGATLQLTRILAAVLPTIFRSAAAQLRNGLLHSEMTAPRGNVVNVYRDPWGPALVIAPWNAPGVIAAHKVASALAAGCPVILKPSEWAPYACRVLSDVIAEAPMPSGTFQLVHGAGNVGARLVQDARIASVSFTGGLVAGRAVARACAEAMKPAQLELGGNNALVALEDADEEAVASGIVTGLTTLNGQWCRALGRIVLPKAKAASILERTLAKLAKVNLGHSLAADSTMGPLIHQAHLATVRGAIRRLVGLGGRPHAPTAVPTLNGSFLAPTLITGVDASLAEDEIFGPVATVHEYATEAEALAIANGTPFGLAGYIYSSDTNRADAFARDMKAGSIKINGVTLLSLHPEAPRPAWGLSGLGDEGTRESILFFTGARVIGRVPSAS